MSLPAKEQKGKYLPEYLGGYIYPDVLVDGEAQADVVAQQFCHTGVNIIVCALDTWAFPQLTTISLLQQFSKTPR